MKRRMGLSRILPIKGKRAERVARPGTLKVIDLTRHAGDRLRMRWDDAPRVPLAKEFADRLLSLGMLIVLLPFLAFVAVAIRLSSSGPIIYRQVRIGQNRRGMSRGGGASTSYYDVYDRRTLDLPGKPFIIFKFRTMVDGAENRFGPIWASKNDPRITLLGRVLRKLRVDELPQLINVVKGDMSLVGPRPERPTFVRDLIDEIPEYAVRLRVKPGITGLAQVKHHYDTCLEDVRTKLRYDLEYIRNLSPLLDLKILIRTIWVVLTMKGSH
ncbi:MAG: sugar transferase [Candidatus Eisenbacteria bacterium]|nr:sugar transferase [Candidatus Eisenbacteria bacterium]